MTNKSQFMKKSAFTLIELSIVVVIIGILAVGITQGSGLISSARLANARSMTSKSPVPNIDGLLAWYEASSKDSLKSSETVDAAQITEWRDISPSSIITQKNKLTKSAGSNALYRVNGVNKVPAIEFNSTGKISIANFYQGATPQATVFIAFKTNFTPSSTQVIPFDANISENRFSLGIKNNAVRLDTGIGANTGTATNPASFISGKEYIVAAYFNGSSSGVYVNNAATLAGSGNIDAGSNSLKGLTIGADKNTNSGFTGMIAEVIIYNRPLKLQERKDVMSYLAKKYKIAVTGI